MQTCKYCSEIMMGEYETLPIILIFSFIIVQNVEAFMKEKLRKIEMK